VPHEGSWELSSSSAAARGDAAYVSFERLELHSAHAVQALAEQLHLEYARAAWIERKHRVISELSLAALRCSVDEAGSCNLRALHERGCSALRELLGCEHAALLETDCEPGALWCNVAQGLMFKSRSQRVELREWYGLQLLLDASEAIAVPVANTEEFVQFGAAIPSAAAGCALRAHDATLGVLVLYRTRGAFSRDELQCIQAVAEVLAAAVFRVRNERRLRAHSAELATSDRQKDEFLAMLGHELRNPLSAIRNATELLGICGQMGEQELGRVHAILERQTHQMAKLIDGLLDISRIMRGKFVLEKKTLELGRILRELVQDHTAPNGGRTPHIELDISGEPLWIEGDGVRVLQVFENLLSNAIKFTPRTGHITVRAHRSDEQAVVSIEDDGVGIDPALLPHIFEPFRQASHNYGGLGMGLALVRGLLELHGGSICAHSRGPGFGSTFTVTLDLTAAPNTPSAPPPLELAQLRVLIVEDNDDLAETLAALLHSTGHQVIGMAQDGVEAIELARSLKPQVVLCDIGLPGELDGLDVARTIRAEAELGDVHMIALTGFGAPDDRIRMREAGFDACLVKPVELDLLRACLAQGEARSGQNKKCEARSPKSTVRSA